MNAAPAACVAHLHDVELRYGRTRALDGVSLEIPAGCMAGLIGPDGVGKSSLLALLSGARVIQSGRIDVLGGDMADSRHRNRVLPRIAYLPQGLGKNLYPTLSVFENVDFFGRLFGHNRAEREQRVGELLRSTGLAPFVDRPAGKLSGGMKQKLGLCCALIHDPDLLILDEPTTGVDPLARRQFWELIDRIRDGRPGMSVLVATAYMEEAVRFDWLAAMNGGRVLATGSPAALRERTGSESLEQAFIALLPAAQREGYRPVEIPPRRTAADDTPAIEARGLTKRFGSFTAVDRVSFRIERGEIFGFLGSNGCGKTTTMKILTGLLPASEGEARLFGRELDPRDRATRHRVGYMTQSFSLYGELTVEQNLTLHARLFGMDAARIPQRVAEVAERFELADRIDALPTALPLGHRQRLSLAVAVIHGPELLILDEPTSGVDPVARDAFWRIMLDLARTDGVTIFISTHFMNEAERCDRISFMHAGRVLVSDTPQRLMEQRGVPTLEDAFIAYLREAAAEEEPAPTARHETEPSGWQVEPASTRPRAFDLRRLLGCARREALELRRDPIRLTLATLGSIILMFVIGTGISLDVENLSFAVLDRDQTTVSRDYALNLSGSRYFTEHRALQNDAELDARMRSGELSLTIEIPPGFARDVARGEGAAIGAWIDGAMPMRSETVSGYVQCMHQHWLGTRAAAAGSRAQSALGVETRFRYNPDVRTLVAIVPAVIPLLLLLIPAMLAALAVVREKELGSIINFYVTPVTRVEFLLGKQLPYLALAIINFALLMLQGTLVLGVPFTGSLLAMTLAAVLYVIAATAFGLVISAFTRSQIAALFGTAILTMMPAVQFSGMIDPVSSLEGLGRFIGTIYPTTHFITVSRGAFAKGLGVQDLQSSFLPLLLAIPVLLALAAAVTRKQER